MRVEVTKKPGRSAANTNNTADKQAKDSVMMRDMENEEIEDLEDEFGGKKNGDPNANGGRKSRKMNE